MKNIRLSFLASAMIAIGSSFIPASQDPCAGQQLYYESSPGVFTPTNKPLNQGCLNNTQLPCKYYKAINGDYLPCSTAIYGRRTFVP